MFALQCFVYNSEGGEGLADDKNLHSGHRERMKDKFLNNHLDAFEQHEALELLLYYAIPRKDTNPIAHKLLNDFGSLSAVFDASVDTLTDSGISKNAAVLLKLIPQISRLYLDDKHNNERKIIDLDAAGEILLNKFIGRDYEAVVLLLMDAKLKEVFCGVISKGSISACDLYVRKIIENALLYNASYAIIAHNHPSGIALPSNNDLTATRQIAQALRLIGVSLLDHIVVADNDYVSIACSGIMKDVFKE